jgi:hypothetical protein
MPHDHALMGHGGRSAQAPAAEIEVTLENQLLHGTVGRPIAYEFRVPAELAAQGESSTPRGSSSSRRPGTRLITGAGRP